MVFPEGAIQPAGPLREVKPGAAWIARAAGVPLVRVVLRGGQLPEAYLRCGPAVTADLAAALARELTALDADLAGSDPEQPLAGYLRLVAGRSSGHERLAWLSRALTRLTGDR